MLRSTEDRDASVGQLPHAKFQLLRFCSADKGKPLIHAVVNWKVWTIACRTTKKAKTMFCKARYKQKWSPETYSNPKWALSAAISMPIMQLGVCQKSQRKLRLQLLLRLRACFTGAETPASQDTCQFFQGVHWNFNGASHWRRRPLSRGGRHVACGGCLCS